MLDLLHPLPQPSRVIRRRARTFYLASLFLPGRIRQDVHLIYAFFRAVDDLADEPLPGVPPGESLARLDTWERALLSGIAPHGSLLHAVLAVADRHAVPVECLHMMLDGARFDLERRQIRDLEDLIRYSRLVAGSVGLVMARLLGARDPEALRCACDLGVAMQLTNVLRDVGEDLARGRVYIPMSALEGAGCTLESVQSRRVTADLQAVMSTLALEARTYYQSGLSGLHYLDPSGRFAIFLAATLYARILDKIERNNFDVFSQRAYLTQFEKWRLAVPAYVQHRQLLRR